MKKKTDFNHFNAFLKIMHPYEKELFRKFYKAKESKPPNIGVLYTKFSWRNQS